MQLTASKFANRLEQARASAGTVQFAEHIDMLRGDPSLNHLGDVRLRIDHKDVYFHRNSPFSWPLRWHDRTLDTEFSQGEISGKLNAEIPQSATAAHALLLLLWISLVSTLGIFLNAAYKVWRTNQELRKAIASANKETNASTECAAIADPKEAAILALRNLTAEIVNRRTAISRHGRNLRTLADRVPVGILMYSASGRIKFVNRHGMTLLGASSLRDRPSNYCELLPIDERNNFSRLLKQLNATGTHSLINVEQRRPMLDIHSNRLSIRSKELIFSSSPTAPIVAVFFQDLTSSDQTEAALQQAIQDARHASDMKSRFLAMISHEIRTPLNGITGLVDLLMRETPAAHQIEYLSLLAGSTHHLKGLLTDILDFSKIEAGQMSLDCMPVNLEQLMRSISQSYEAAASSKGLTLRLSINGSSLWVKADAVRLRQIISNLIDNAIKFSHSGYIDISLTTTPAAASGASLLVKIEVADQGIGIDSEVLKRLFTPFTQANLSITRTFGGTGLGLSLCRLLSRMMGGDVAAKSTLGVGSTFSLFVQLEKCQPIEEYSQRSEQETSNASSSNPPLRQLDKVSLLVADDNSLNQRIMKRWLELRGAAVDLAGNGEEAVTAAKNKQYDAILMDISMPVMNGIDAAKEIRMIELKLERRAVPIIGVTALSTPDDYSTAIFSGMTACIGKPVDRAELMAQVDKALSNNALTHSSRKETHEQDSHQTLDKL